MMIDLSTIMIGNRVVLVRGFVNNDNSNDLDVVRKNILIIKSMLQNPVQATQTNRFSFGDDISEGISTELLSLGINIGNKKQTQPMQLPNGLVPNKISADKIVEQIVILNDKSQNTSQIQCLNPSIRSSQKLDDKAISEGSLDFVFPKGGPKQRTWLDIRDELSNISSVIEIGILDIDRAIETTKATNQTDEEI